MVIDGQVEVNKQVLNKRDAIEIIDVISIDIKSDADLLAIEVPV